MEIDADCFAPAAGTAAEVAVAQVKHSCEKVEAAETVLGTHEEAEWAGTSVHAKCLVLVTPQPTWLSIEPWLPLEFSNVPRASFYVDPPSPGF